MTAPRLTVLVRSYNRLPALCELLAALLRQRHDAFEVVVVEQSTDRPAAAEARLAALAADPRIRIVRAPPLGGARARNLGVEHARGEVIVCIDDDDLPVGDEFLAAIERPFRDDPRCLALTCRHEWSAGERVSWPYRVIAARLCLRFSPLLRVPHNFPRLDRALDRVDYVHGTGGAFRRAVFERFGGWDEDTPIEDEASLGIRMQRGLAPGERVAFVPEPRLRRRFDVAGGLGKRQLAPGGYFARFMRFVHAILGRYHPWRVRLLYPLYVVTAWRWTIAWLWDDAPAPVGRKLVATIAFTAALPWHAARAAREPLGRAPGAGVALRDRLADASREGAPC